MVKPTINNYKIIFCFWAFPPTNEVLDVKLDLNGLLLIAKIILECNILETTQIKEIITKSVEFRIQTIKKANSGIAPCISMNFVDDLALKNINSIEHFFLQISADTRENPLYYDYQEVKKTHAYTE